MEILGPNPESNNNEIISLDSLPKSALQAIYHSVTGKTESMSKELTGNVVVNIDDIERLYQMFIDQLGIHQCIIDPTVTVVAKHENQKSYTYSSWKRFKNLRVNNHELTSEISIKLEFVIQIPGTPQPQRCVINLNIDSSLILLIKEKEKLPGSEVFGFYFFFNRNWKTVELTIDFVDFLIARSFVGIVEEWFSSLQKTPSKNLNDFLFKNMD
jgi:hypothetical protein